MWLLPEPYWVEWLWWENRNKKVRGLAQSHIASDSLNLGLRHAWLQTTALYCLPHRTRQASGVSGTVLIVRNEGGGLVLPLRLSSPMLWVSNPAHFLSNPGLSPLPAGSQCCLWVSSSAFHLANYVLSVPHLEPNGSHSQGRWFKTKISRNSRVLSHKTIHHQGQRRRESGIYDGSWEAPQR